MKYLFILVGLILIIGCSEDTEASAELDGALVTYDELTGELEKLELDIELKEEELEEASSELRDTHTEMGEVNLEIGRERDALIEAMEIYENREEINKELSEKEKTLEGLDKEISEKEEELSSITGELKEVGEEPITLSAGHYIVGHDIDEGRYKAEIEGSSGNFNFKVEDIDGRNKVNAVLGDTERAEESFIFFAESRDRLDVRTTMKFTEVE